MIGSPARGGLLHDPAVPGKGWEGCHDLTGPRSLVCIAGELREREAERAARAARRRASWLFRLLRRIRDWRARWDRGAERRPGTKLCAPSAGSTADQRGGICDACRQAAEENDRDARLAREAVDERMAAFDPNEQLALARAAALRDGRADLANAIHALQLLDLTGNLDDMAPLVVAVRATFEQALGDDPQVH